MKQEYNHNQQHRESIVKSIKCSRPMSSYAQNSGYAVDAYSQDSSYRKNEVGVSHTYTKLNPDTHIEPYFKEHAEHDLYEQVKHLKPSQREKKLERIATIWLKELG